MASILVAIVSKGFVPITGINDNIKVIIETKIVEVFTRAKVNNNKKI